VPSMSLSSPSCPSISGHSSPPPLFSTASSTWSLADFSSVSCWESRD